MLGFINLGVLTICVSFMRPRLPPRKSGPLVDWSAFREPVWNIFILGMWLIFWAVYYTFYYVSPHYTFTMRVPHPQDFTTSGLPLCSGPKY